MTSFQKKSAVQSNEHTRWILLNQGMKVTKARLAVLREFGRLNRPASIREITDMLENGVADRVTIYRIIQALAEKGIIREVNLRHNHVDYEMADSGDHHHIVCVKCNLVKDFDGCNAEKLERAVLKQCPEFKIVSEHAIELFGTCKKCAESA